MKRTVTLAYIALALCQAAQAQDFTRGVGVYPGDAKEDAAPILRVDDATYRNLALHRPAYQSSSYDYNLTAQLVTDGIVGTSMPRWLVTATGQDGVPAGSRALAAPRFAGSLRETRRQQGVLPKREREWFLDGNWVSSVDLKGASGWVQVELHGGDAAPAVTAVAVEARVLAESEGPENWSCAVLGSADGAAWSTLGRASGMTRQGGDIAPTITFDTASRHRYYRIVFDDPRAVVWRVSEVRFLDNGRPVGVGGPYWFDSAWMSEGRGDEWVSVDLGAPSTIDRVALHWMRRAAEGTVQASDDGRTWRTLQPLPTGASALLDDIKLARPVRARHVRVQMTRPASPEGYILGELEVFGRGGLVPQAKAAPAPRPDGRLDLAGGGWRIQRDSLVTKAGAAIATAGFDDRDWLVATVPGTVLVSYLNAGAIPDPNVGDNQLAISDSFFHADFWYRNEFVAPAAAPGRHVWLNFDGVNWKAEVFLNGESIGRVEGGFTRGRFDVTRKVKPGQPNALAVRIEKNATPGSVKEKTFETPDKNGGALGADNPTYHASIGWDWIPTIRGRNTGLWNDVFLSTTGAVTVEDPAVSTTLPLPDTSRADVQIGITLRNHETTPQSGTVRGRFGDVTFAVPVSLEASAARTIRIDPSTVPALRLQQPRLWWPAGYGEPDLYDVELRFELDGARGDSDAKAFKAGVRQFTHSIEGGALRMWINGRRFVPRGGNWGFPESMLRYRAREYDVAVRYHRDMHFNMIRNWVGQTGDDEFYEACDRHGIVVWQDFWLANPWDGPDPDVDPLFMQNVTDTVRRVRTHASVGLYCGRNEGYPPKSIDDAIRTTLAAEHPGLPYISSSADDVASGHGPYRAMPTPYYFTDRATPKFHSEMGMPNIMSLDSLRQAIPADGLWPMGRMWGLHDFCLEGAQGGSSFLERIQRSYGSAASVDEWVWLAQFVNYEGYRAMFEAQSRHRMGLLIWMSHPAWPSLVWQTYDFYFEPTAAYFGSKKASEPLHVQWNPVTERVEVVNYSAGNLTGLTVRAQVLGIDGRVMWEKTVPVDSAEDTTVGAIDMQYPLGVSPTHFIRLTLSRGQALVSENFYWRGLQEGNFQQLRTLPAVTLEAATTVRQEGSRWILTTELHNASATPALMVRARAVREQAGDRILPVLHSDNYVALMPGERRTIVTEVQHADTRGERPRIVVDGFNVTQGRQAADAPRREDRK